MDPASNPGLEERLKKIEERLEQTYLSAEKTRKYILYTIIGTVVTFVLPLIALAFVVPFFLSTLSSISNI